MNSITKMLNDRTRLARYLFSLDAVLGVLAIGVAAFSATAYSSGSIAEAFFPPFLSITLVWLLFCYGAHKGLTNLNAFGKLVFWLFVIGHFFVFPIGTLFSGVFIWLWSERSKPNSDSYFVATERPTLADPSASRPPE